MTTNNASLLPEKLMPNNLINVLEWLTVIKYKCSNKIGSYINVYAIIYVKNKKSKINSKVKNKILNKTIQK